MIHRSWHKTILQRLRWLAAFYRPMLLLWCCVAVPAVVLSYRHGWPVFTGLFWLKIISGGLGYFFVNQQYRFQYYYYHNLGLSKRWLWAMGFSIDFLAYLLLIITTNKLR